MTKLIIALERCRKVNSAGFVALCCEITLRHARVGTPNFRSIPINGSESLGFPIKTMHRICKGSLWPSFWDLTRLYMMIHRGEDQLFMQFWGFSEGSTYPSQEHRSPQWDSIKIEQNISEQISNVIKQAGQQSVQRILRNKASETDKFRYVEEEVRRSCTP